MMTTLALASLMDTFLWAAYQYVRTDNVPTNNRSIKRHADKLGMSQDALAFIAGTGLEVMMESYGLAYDADELRHYFYMRFHVKQN